nr:FAD/NAD(P)-binding oxidoreductase [Aliamphritea spongicola]
MEAARVAAERGHKVTVFEAAPLPGGQIRLCAQNKRRHEMISIIDWRMEQCERRQVEFRFNTFAERSDIEALQPDVVIIATGGFPDTEVLEQGNELMVSSWDIISGDVKPGNNVLIYDDAGDHAGLQAAEVIAASGATTEIMTPDRSFAPEVMAMNLVPYMRELQAKRAKFTVTYRLLSAERDGTEIKATIGTDYSDHTYRQSYDQIVVNHGTLPLDDLYFELKDISSNSGAMDQEALLAGKPQTLPIIHRGSSSCFALATPCIHGIPTQPFMTPCGL